MSINKWQSAAITGNLHPELVKLAAELGITPVAANGRNQCYLNGVWVGFYAGPWGASPWQVGPQRVCMSRESVIALLTKGEEPTVTSPSLRNFTEVAAAKVLAAAEAPKPVAAPVAAIVAPSIDVASVVVAALAAGKTNDEVLALIAALKA